MSLEWSCEVCGAKRGQPCENKINPGEPIPYREQHWAWAIEPDKSSRKGSDTSGKPKAAQKAAQTPKRAS